MFFFTSLNVNQLSVSVNQLLVIVNKLLVSINDFLVSIKLTFGKCTSIYVKCK